MVPSAELISTCETNSVRKKSRVSRKKYQHPFCLDGVHGIVALFVVSGVHQNLIKDLVETWIVGDATEDLEGRREKKERRQRVGQNSQIYKIAGTILFWTVSKTHMFSVVCSTEPM